MNNRIGELRKHLGLTQAAFGEKIGLSRDAIASYERDNAKPTAVALKCISTVFNVSLDWLETGEGEMFAGKSAEDLAIESALRAAGDSPAIRALLVAYSRLNEHNRAVFEQFVEDYVAEYQAGVAARDAAAAVVPAADLQVKRVPIIGTAYNDGSVETKYAAMQEQNELAADAAGIPVPDDPALMAMEYPHNDLPDTKIIR